ncbi:1-phosphofructokinase family hexose kinase [Nocardioides sp. KR10-350]|uniref:1-phosphofructokinase family hexose kinase n=1 Tax=Nocardioides cheoyonin TaxID=3156615 RepID=UPI0032B59012
MTAPLDPVPRVLTLTLNPALDEYITVPRLEPAVKLRCGQPFFHAGGGGINVARALAALGEQVLAVFPSAGHLGRFLEELLATEGTPYAAVPIAGETRQSHNVSETGTGREYRFVLPGPPLRPPDQRACLARLQACGSADFLVLSGSLPPGVEPGFVHEVARTAECLGARLVLDTSGPALAEAKGAYVAKPSLRELRELLGEPLVMEQEQVLGARQLIARGTAEVIALSRGERGLLLVTDDLAEEIPAMVGRVRGTVGAGDALVAGLLFGLGRGWELVRAGRFAVACSTATLGVDGTAMLDRDVVARLSPELLEIDA